MAMTDNAASCIAQIALLGEKVLKYIIEETFHKMHYLSKNRLNSRLKNLIILISNLKNSSYSSYIFIHNGLD